MRAHRGRPGPIVLLVGESVDLPELCTMLQALPRDAYGQVYVEVASAVQVEHLPRPGRVAVTWLVRDTAEAPLRARGELLLRAVDGWLAEWTPAPGSRRIVWIGSATGPVVAERCRSLLHAEPAPALGVLPDED